MAEHHRLGRRGEEVAADLLLSKGYQVLSRNFRSGKGEIDIIVADKSGLVFVEVKTRSGRFYGSPAESITDYKRQVLRRTAMAYLVQTNQTDMPCRFDVVEVEVTLNGYQVNHIQNAF